MKTPQLAILSALLAFSSLPLFAAPLSWDPGQSLNTTPGGSGNWDQSSSAWFNGTADVVWANANNDDAILSGTAGTVTLTENISAGNLRFTNAIGNYVVTTATGSEALTIAGAIDTGGGEHTVGAPIVNSNTLTKNGAGRLHLNVDNSATLTGNVVINQGDVSLEHPLGAGQRSSITVADGAALVLNGNTTVSLYPNVTINGSGITNSGALRNLSGVTTFYGQIILGGSNSMIYSDNGSALAYIGAYGPLTDNGNNYNLTIRGSGTGNVHLGPTSMTGSLIVQGPASCYAYLIGTSPTDWKSTYITAGGTLYVEAPNSFGTQPTTLMTTNVVLDGGTISSTGTYTMYATDGITLTANGGTLTNSTGTWTTCNIYSPSNGALTLTGAGPYRPGGAAGTTTGTINLGTGTLIKGGGGDCNLTYAATNLVIYSNLVVNGGSLTFNYDQTANTLTGLGALPTTLNVSNIVLNGGSLHVGHSTTIGATRGIYVGSSGGSISDVTTSGTVTINSPISGPGSMNFPNGKSGSTTTVTLTANNSYSGTTTIGASSALNVGSGGATGTLGAGNTTDNGTLTFNRTGNYPYGKVISGTGWVVKSGAGTLTLSGANTYSGNTTNNTGTLLINNTNGSGTGTGSVFINSGTLGGTGFISGAVTINSGATLAPGPMVASTLFPGTLTISNNLTIAGNVTISIFKSLSTTSPSNGAVYVTGTLANTGSGTLTVTNMMGPRLAVGDTFHIFNQPLTGNAMTISGGGGVTWNNNLAVDGTISVATVPPVPTPGIASYSFNAGNLILAGTNGTPSGSYMLLTSTNVAASLANWIVFTNGFYDASGNFAITNAISNGAPVQFFVIQSN